MYNHADVDTVDCRGAAFYGSASNGAYLIEGSYFKENSCRWGAPFFLHFFFIQKLI